MRIAEWISPSRYRSTGRSLRYLLVTLLLAACQVTPIGVEGAAPSDTSGQLSGPVEGLESGFVDRILEDDVVTRSEMEQAYLRYLKCLTDNGGVVEYYYNLDYGPGMPYTVGFGGGPSQSDSESEQQILTACETSFLGEMGVLAVNFGESVDIDPDAAQRQLVSIQICISGLDKELGENAAQISDISLLHEITDDPALSAGVNDCILTNGEGYKSFGE